MFQQLIKINIIYQKELFVGFCALVISIIVSIIIKKAKNNYPPGPVGLPIVGYLPFLTDKPYLKLIQLSKIYGDVFSLKFGSRAVIVLNSADVIKEALLKPEFLDRPPYGALIQFKEQSPFFTCPVHIWKEQRRFVVQSMKDLGLGKSKIEEHIKDEVSSFLEVLSTQEGRDVNIAPTLASSVSNNISALVFGVRYPYNHPTRIFLDNSSQFVSEYISQTRLLDYVPWLRLIPFIFKKSAFNEALAIYSNFRNYFRVMIQEHKETLNPQNIRDYVDSYLIQMKSMKEKNINTTFTEETLLGSTMDLFVAGSGTLRTTLSWCIYIIAAYSETQRKVQKEIADVIGFERKPEFLDQKSMPFTQAVIMEILRWITIVPLNVLHYTTSNTSVGGYDIPQGTAVLANFWAVHHDPKHWEDPNTFNPERFLSKEGKCVLKSPNYMPFSLGKRVCPGETMAYMEIFLYFTSLLQKFNVEFKPGTKPTFESFLNITLKPYPFEVQFLPRITAS